MGIFVSLGLLCGLIQSLKWKVRSLVTHPSLLSSYLHISNFTAAKPSVVSQQTMCETCVPNQYTL